MIKLETSVLRPLRAVLRKHPAIYYGTLVIAVVAIWSAIFGRVPGTEAFHVPVEYRGDALFLAGVLRGFSEFPAPWNLHIGHLNAPFGADWNDYPHSEKLLFYLGGALVRLFDSGVAVNLLLLFAFVFNAVGFCWTARRFGAGPLRAMAGATMFAFSSFALFRSVPHLVLVYVGHIPLILYLCRRLQHVGSNRRGLWIWGSVCIVVSAFLNPYYFVFALLLIALVSLRLVVQRRMRDVLISAVLLAEGLVVFVVNQSNVLIYRRLHGESPLIHQRLLPEQIRWGLRLPDLFMPLEHPLRAWANYAKQNYFVPEFVSENLAAFLGLVGCVGLAAIIIVSLLQGMRRRIERVPYEMWIILLVYIFCSPGGGALLMAVSGFSWLRATNRYSIVILCAVLLWLGRVCRFRCAPMLGGVVCVALTAFTVWESSKALPMERRLSPAALVKADRSFVQELERQLPQGAAVFQVPVMAFPESPPIVNLLDYDPFRPYLWSKTLRFSYGTHKGRPREIWQAQCARKPAREMVGELAAKGFSAILVQRSGFADRGRALEAALSNAGLSRIAGGADTEMVSYRLQ